jgi:hypothetical protein
VGGVVRLVRRTSHLQEQHSSTRLKALYGNEEESTSFTETDEVDPEWVPSFDEGELSFVGKDTDVRQEVVETNIITCLWEFNFIRNI